MILVELFTFTTFGNEQRFEFGARGEFGGQLTLQLGDDDLLLLQLGIKALYVNNSPTRMR